MKHGQLKRLQEGQGCLELEAASSHSVVQSLYMQQEMKQNAEGDDEGCSNGHDALWPMIYRSPWKGGGYSSITLALDVALSSAWHVRTGLLHST